MKEFSAFLRMGGCKSLGSLKSFLSYASQLSGASILCFSHPELVRACCMEWLQPDVCWITGILLLRCPRGSEINIWRACIADDCDILVYWYGRKLFHFSIHCNNHLYLWPAVTAEEWWSAKRLKREEVDHKNLLAFVHCYIKPKTPCLADGGLCSSYISWDQESWASFPGDYQMLTRPSFCCPSYIYRSPLGFPHWAWSWSYNVPRQAKQRNKTPIAQHGKCHLWKRVCGSSEEQNRVKVQEGCLEWRRKQTEQAPSWKQDSILGWTVDFELHAQYLWKPHTNWKTRPQGWKSPRAHT